MKYMVLLKAAWVLSTKKKKTTLICTALLDFI